MVSTATALQDAFFEVCKETSPDSKCPICLDRFSNVSYTDRCFHRFCFCCIVEWGRNKAECPLCKQAFGAVYHSVQSEDDFKLYELPALGNGSFGSVGGQRFRYRTTLTRPQRAREDDSRQQEVLCFRRWLYRYDVRVRSVRDGGRSRDTSAEFFRKNPACLHRLVPWLKRELAILCGSHDLASNIVLHAILSLITRHNMHDEDFLPKLRPFLSTQTEHFLHEFLSFAKSPFNMEAYDRHAVYDCPAPLRLSTALENDVGISAAPSAWDDETPGPSYSSATRSVLSITISDSDVHSATEEEEEETVTAIANNNGRVDVDYSSSDEDCVIVGFIKPTTQRTPELVQLSSDSEASVQKEPEAFDQLDMDELTNQICRITGGQRVRSATIHNAMTSYRTRRRRRRSSERRRRRNSERRNSVSSSRRSSEWRRSSDSRRSEGRMRSSEGRRRSSDSRSSERRRRSSEWRRRSDSRSSEWRRRSSEWRRRSSEWRRRSSERRRRSSECMRRSYSRSSEWRRRSNDDRSSEWRRSSDGRSSEGRRRRSEWRRRSDSRSGEWRRRSSDSRSGEWRRRSSDSRSRERRRRSDSRSGEWRRRRSDSRSRERRKRSDSRSGEWRRKSSDTRRSSEWRRRGSHRWRSRSLSYKKGNKATSHTSSSHTCTHSQSRRFLFSESTTHMRSGSTTRAHSDSGTQASLQDRKSPFPTLDRRSGCLTHNVEQKHELLHRKKRRKSKKEHHPKKKKKKNRRRSFSMEDSAERIKHRKKKTHTHTK